MRRPTQIGLLGLTIVLPTYYLLIVEAGFPFKLPVSDVLFPWATVLISADELWHSGFMYVAGLLFSFLQFPSYVCYLFWADRRTRLSVACCTIAVLHLLALSANYTMTFDALHPRLTAEVKATSFPNGELHMSKAEFSSLVTQGMTRTAILNRLGQPRKHYHFYDTRSATNAVLREVEYWEYSLVQPSSPIAAILSTNGVVEKITEDTDPIVIQL